MRLDGTLGERRREAERRRRSQPGRDGGGAGGGRVQSRGGSAVRGGPRRADGCHAPRWRDGRRFRPGLSRRLHGGGTERRLGRCRPQRRRRQRTAAGRERAAGGSRGGSGSLRGRGRQGRAIEAKPRLPQRADRARTGRPGSRRPRPHAGSSARLRAPGEQPHGPAAGAGRTDGRRLLETAGAGGGGVPPLRGDAGGVGRGCRRGDRPPRRTGDCRGHDVARIGTCRGTGHPRQPAASAAGSRGTRGGHERRFRGGGGGSLRGGARHRFRRPVRRRKPTPDLAPGLPVPAQAPLGPGVETPENVRRAPASRRSTRIAPRRGDVRDGDVRFRSRLDAGPPGLRARGRARGTLRCHGRVGGAVRMERLGGRVGHADAQRPDLRRRRSGGYGAQHGPQAAIRAGWFRGWPGAPVRDLQQGGGRGGVDPARRRAALAGWGGAGNPRLPGCG